MQQIKSGQVWESKRYGYEYEVTLPHTHLIHTKSLQSGLKVTFPRKDFHSNFTLVDTGDYLI